MSKLTVSLPEQTARWVRVWATAQGKSVSAALAQLIEDKRRKRSASRRALVQLMGTGPSDLSGGQRYPPRESLHER